MHARHVLAYGALGFPLAFAALPLYVHVPRLYADSVGLPLALVGGLLLAARFADALVDPLLGQWSDCVGNRRRLILLALAPLGLGLATLLAPPPSAGAGWLLATLALTFLGFSLASINYHAWGAELGSSPRLSLRFTGAREMFALAGVVVAAALPALLAPDMATALARLGWIFLPLLALAALMTLAATPSVPAAPAGGDTRSPLAAVVADQGFRRLLAVLAIGGIAAAIPATLVLFFIADVLRLDHLQGLFLAIYFVCGGLALPAWTALAQRIGKPRAWALSMLLAIASFAWAFGLGPGDGLAFGLICALSGAALGAELALPPALLADHLAARRARGEDTGGTGAYFGIWNFVTKFNLALAAGIALPLVSLAGYKVGAGGTAEQGLAALAAVYALLPAALKLAALALLWRWRTDFTEHSQ